MTGCFLPTLFDTFLALVGRAFFGLIFGQICVAKIVRKTELLLAHIGLMSGWLLIGLAFTDDSELSTSLGGARLQTVLDHFLGGFWRVFGLTVGRIWHYLYDDRHASKCDSGYGLHPDRSFGVELLKPVATKSREG